MPKIFIFGLGYTSLALAGQLQSQGWQVTGTTRTPLKQRERASLGIGTYVWRRDEPISALTAALAGHAYVLQSIPPDELGDPILSTHLASLIQHAPQLKWVGYLSSSAVYGDAQGAWVDEKTPPAPVSPSGQRRWQAEQQWLALASQGLPVHIFRLSGIYGPERNALLDVLSGSARRIDKPGQVFNRIHVADIVQVLQASMHAPQASEIYNLADHAPTSSAEVIAYAAELLGLPIPPLEPFATAQASMSPMAQGFYASSKRLKNEKMIALLRPQSLLYPTYREGLAACRASLPATLLQAVTHA